MQFKPIYNFISKSTYYDTSIDIKKSRMERFEKIDYQGNAH